MAISPWTRGGKVFTESCDHISQIFLLEQWLKVKGKDITSAEINDWRREHMCDFTDVRSSASFNSPSRFLYPFSTDIRLCEPRFLRPRAAVCAFPSVQQCHQSVRWSEQHPNLVHRDIDVFLRQDIVCEAMFPVVQPEIPYGEQDPATALWVESGFRQVIGILTEGRYLVFEEASGSKNLGLSVSDSHGRLTLTSSSVPTQKESDVSHRFIIHTQGIFPQSLFQLQTGVATSSASYLNSKLEFVTKAQAATFSIEYDSVTQTYTLQDVSSKKFISVSSKGEVELSSSSTAFSVFSVTFN
jgi:phospholipase C